MTEPFALLRAGSPKDHHWADPRAPAPEGLALGDEAWEYAIPWVFRALAAPSTGTPFPRVPIANGPHHESLAYWGALVAMLRWSLGWARIDRGLRWWYDAGKPTDDPRLRLLAEAWDADRQLDWFAAWAWSRTAQKISNEALSALTGYVGARLPVESDERWLDEQARAVQAEGVFYNPFTGGNDPLHLSMHADSPLEKGSRPGLLLRSDRATRRAVLLVDQWAGWYRGLVEQEGNLPDLGNRSWRVDVVVRPIGWIGTYRRSRSTGLWFSGRHRWHTKGC